MAVTLTPGAIVKMLNGEVESEQEMMPVVQVTELKLVQSKLQQHQQLKEPTKERFRILLSDGTYVQQGMLGTSQNDLVKKGILQVGSVVKLTRFVCNVIQNRRIVIVIELEMVIEKCKVIGNPVQPGKPNDPSQSTVDQRGRVIPDNQSASSSCLLPGSVNKPYAGGYELSARGSEMPGDLQINNSGTGSFAATGLPHVRPKPEIGTSSGFPGSGSSSGPSGNPSAGYGSSRQEHPWPPTGDSHPVRPAYQPQPLPMYSNRGPVAKNEAAPRIIPIYALNPYQGRWTIKARVTSKAEFRHYNNARGEGKVFSFDLLDADGGEIRVTCFNAVADQFYNHISAGNVYLISRGSLRPAQKNFNHLHNDYEIILDGASSIQQCYEDNSAIPHHQFHFRLISDIESMESNTVVDVIGVVTSISPTASIMRKNGTETQKRALHLKDVSGRSVELTMWGNFCNADGHKLQTLCDSGEFPVLAVKSGRISDFNGKAVGTIASSQLFIEPDCIESQRLKEWFEREGRNTPSVSISREISSIGRQDVHKTISQIKDEKLGMSEKPDWITVSASILYVKADNFCYTACPIMNGGRPCNKKVTNNGDGTWRCDKCDQCVNECDYRYILQLQIQDHTGLTWVTAFQEAGEEIMGISAKDLYCVKYEHQDDDKFSEIIRRVGFTKYIFKLKIKEETFSDEQRVKATVLKAEKLDYSSNSRFLLDSMDKLRTGDSSSLIVKPESSNYNSDMVNRSLGTSGTRETSSVGTAGDFRLPANQVGQYRSQSIGSSAPTSVTSCDTCGSSGHVSANCPSIMSDPEQYRGGAYSGRMSSGEVTPGRYGGLPRQHVGSY